MRVGVATDTLDYYPHTEASPCIVSVVQGPKPGAASTLTTTERTR